MKRLKKTERLVIKTHSHIYSCVCPHCKTICQGFSNTVLVFNCFHCHNPIDLRPKEIKK